MDPTAHTAHAGHDELLIARLFDGDVTETERSLALDAMADCQECASLFADLGAIAEATAVLPSPTRPRDFSLTEADAARLRKPARGRWAVFGMGLRRSLGSSMAALGIVGVILTGASSLLSSASTPGLYSLSPERAAAAPDQGAVVGTSAGSTPLYMGPKDVASAGVASVPATVPSPAPVAVAASAAGTSGNVLPASSAAVPPATGAIAAVPQPAASAADTHDLAAASPLTAQGNFGSGPGTTNDGSGAVSGSNGVDARLVLLAAFAALFAGGLAIAILPIRRRGRGRGIRS
jgi:hypothetical protein